MRFGFPKTLLMLSFLIIAGCDSDDDPTAFNVINGVASKGIVAGANVTVIDASGNQLDVSATTGDDGSYTIHFGGDPTAINFLPITEGWNYTVRMYQPRQEIIDGKWKFPAPTPANSQLK